MAIQAFLSKQESAMGDNGLFLLMVFAIAFLTSIFSREKQ